MTGFAQAETYPWIPLHAGEIQVVADPKVEAALRLDLIRNARSTIDILTYDQRLDPSIGMPLLVALREAAERGVKVRFLDAWFTELLTDFHELVPRYLTEPETREPIQVRIVGGFQAHHRGWGLADGIHGKLVVVDGRFAMTTGRGQSDYYLRWLDTAFLLQGELVSQSQAAYEKLWQDSAALNGVYRRRKHYLTSPIPAPHLDEPRLDAREQGERSRLEASLNARAGAPEEGKARLLHYDFLHQMRELPGRPRGYNYAERVRLLTDPVIDALAERIRRTSAPVRCTTLSVILHPKLKAALIEALDRGVSVRILTNAPSAFKTLKSPPAPWWVSLPDMEDVMRHGAEVAAIPLSPRNPWVYFHRKTAIIGDAVIFGSHNFNLPSSVANDEISYEAEDPELARQIGDLFEQAWRDYAVPQRIQWIDKQRKLTFLQRWAFRPFLGLF